MTTKVSATISAALVATLLDPTRIVMIALGLKHLRSAHPEMFDGHAARLSIELAIAEEQDA